MSYAPLDETNGRRKHPPVVHHQDNDEPIISSSTATNASNLSPSSSNHKQALSEPLTGNGVQPSDPYYVFREDLYRKLELVDEAMAEYLRVVHETVRDVAYIRSLLTTLVLLLSLSTNRTRLPIPTN